MKQIDFKLKSHEKEKLDYNKTLLTEFDILKSMDFEDFSKNHTYIQRVREFKIQIADSDSRLKDIEELQKEVVKVLTEQDIEKSSELLGLKTQ